MVTNNHQLSVMNHGRTTFAKTRSHLDLAKITFPDLIPIQVETVEARQTEPTIKMLAVGHGGTGCVVVVVVMPFVRNQLIDFAPPNLLTGRSIETEHDEFEACVRSLDVEKVQFSVDPPALESTDLLCPYQWPLEEKACHPK